MSPWREQLCGQFDVQEPRQVLRFCDCVALQLHFRELQAATCAFHCGISQYEHTFVRQTLLPELQTWNCALRDRLGDALSGLITQRISREAACPVGNGW